MFFKSESLLSNPLLRARNKLLSRIVFSLAHKNRLYSTRKPEQFETFLEERRARDLLSPAGMGTSGLLLLPPPLCLAEADNNKNLRISRGGDSFNGSLSLSLSLSLLLLARRQKVVEREKEERETGLGGLRNLRVGGKGGGGDNVWENFDNLQHFKTYEFRTKMFTTEARIIIKNPF